MPHCIIEHSNDLTPKPLIDAVYQGSLESALFQPDDIKTRTIAYQHYQSGELPQSFVHVTAKILSGRNIEQRRQLAQLILQAIEKVGLKAISLTVEIVQIENESYAKIVKV